MGNANCGSFACDLLAFDAAERDRHRELLQRLRTDESEVIEFQDGYRFRMNGGRVSFRDAAEWVDLERRCCPFLVFDLQIEGGQNAFTLSVSGPAGVKHFIDSELR